MLTYLSLLKFFVYFSRWKNLAFYTNDSTTLMFDLVENTALLWTKDNDQSSCVYGLSGWDEDYVNAQIMKKWIWQHK